MKLHPTCLIITIRYLPHHNNSLQFVQQEHEMVGLASLTLGPALKLQADCFSAPQERQRVQFTTLSEKPQAPATPTGRRLPRKGTPKLSPFNDDSWNDKLVNSDPFLCTSSDDERYAEATAYTERYAEAVSHCVFPYDSGDDGDTAWSDRTQYGMDTIGCDRAQYLGDSEGMVTRDNTLVEPTCDSARVPDGTQKQCSSTAVLQLAETSLESRRMASGSWLVTWALPTDSDGDPSATGPDSVLHAYLKSQKTRQKHRQCV
eukprot:1873390-Rhodomonas_salina.1